MFRIKFEHKNEWNESRPIQLQDVPKAFKQTGAITLTENGFVQLEIAGTKTVFNFIVRSTVENNVRTIIVKPTIVVCNYSKYNLGFLAFCLPRSEKRDFKSIVTAVDTEKSRIPISRNEGSNGNL